jgi:ribosomal protein S18 acetylase RimI-like enzyme
MRQLRPHLLSVQEFVDCWRNQEAFGYRLLVLWDEGPALAAAGFRVQENLVHGRHLYVDDLVTSVSARSNGYGQAVMEHIVREGRQLGCTKLLLDTPVSNALGHRFYFRQGLFVTAFRFTMEL